MSKPCPTCGRVGTVHRLYGRSCLTCDPYTEEELAWHEFTFHGGLYRVQGIHRHMVTAAIERARLVDGGKVRIEYDGGGLGKDAVARKELTARDWLTRNMAVYLGPETTTGAESQKLRRGNKKCRSCEAVIPAALRKCTWCGEQQ